MWRKILYSCRLTCLNVECKNLQPQMERCQTAFHCSANSDNKDLSYLSYLSYTLITEFYMAVVFY